MNTGILCIIIIIIIIIVIIIIISFNQQSLNNCKNNFQSSKLCTATSTNACMDGINVGVCNGSGTCVPTSYCWEANSCNPGYGCSNPPGGIATEGICTSLCTCGPLTT